MSNSWFEINEGRVRTERATASGAGRRTPCSSDFPSREMQSVPARHRMETDLKPLSYASLYRCSLWMSVHAPSTGNRLQTH